MNKQRIYFPWIVPILDSTKRMGRKSDDCIIATQLWDVVHIKINLYFEKLFGIFTSCRTGEVIFGYLAYNIHVNIYAW